MIYEDFKQPCLYIDVWASPPSTNIPWKETLNKKILSLKTGLHDALFQQIEDLIVNVNILLFYVMLVR